MQRRSGVFVVLEGLPGSGKTTVGSKLEERGWIFLREAATLLGEKAVLIGDRGNSDSDYLIMAEELRRTREISEHLRNDRKVVTDGYFPTDLSFAYARYMTKQSKSYPACLNMYLSAIETATIVKPDLYVFFEIPRAVSVNRQLDRFQENYTTLDAETLRLVTKHFRFMHEVFEGNVPVRKVDGQRPVDELVQFVLIETEKIRAAPVAQLSPSSFE